MTSVTQPKYLKVPSGSHSITSEAETNGEVFTRRWIVDLILDLVGFDETDDLGSLRTVEPACGHGAFLIPMVERLSNSLHIHRRSLYDAKDSLSAFDLVEGNVLQSRKLIHKYLVDAGWPSRDSTNILEHWVKTRDYLLSDENESNVDFVIGNPPYIRLEDIPNERSNAYRKAWPTMGGRADIYVGFLEAGLDSLRDRGRLGFICADRWMRNQYGARIREKIGEFYSVDISLVAHDVDAFENQVSAYPAIIVISKTVQGEVVAATADKSLEEGGAKSFVKWVHSESRTYLNSGVTGAKLPHWFSGKDSWPNASPERLAVLEYLNDNFDPLEDSSTGTRVGIGVATGADEVFVVPSAINVESERLLPLTMNRDNRSGAMVWSGHYLVNPWGADGKLINLTDWPLTHSYLEAHSTVLLKRHVAEARPSRWFATIDRVDPLLTNRPKLLFADMKKTIEPVLEGGGYYPHHNLYYVISDVWDLHVLGGLLLSKVAELFIDAYGVKMRGGTLRFQAQYLRRIRVPNIESISIEDQLELAEAFKIRDTKRATDVSLRLYGINEVPE